jgi:hypothetical protein
MYVKDLKVGAMYRLKDFDGLPNIKFGYYPNYEDCMVSIAPGNGNLGDKFVYLGTKILEYKEGLFGDKVLPIAPDLWAYIEPME